FPATSVQLPLTTVPVVSLVTCWSLVQETTPPPPESPLAVKLTVTSALFQPAPFGAGMRWAVGAPRGEGGGGGGVVPEPVRIMAVVGWRVMEVAVWPAGVV